MLFDQIIQQLSSRNPAPPLFPQRAWNEALSQQIARADDAELLGQTSGGTMTTACRAGLLLWNDDLETSHNLAQNIEDATGSFWHAIMHRREGDAANSQYWWRKTGAHPAFADVYTEAMSVLDNETNREARAFAAALQRAGTWVPLEFVARCEMARREPGADDWLQRVQVAETATLLAWCRNQISK